MESKRKIIIRKPSSEPEQTTPKKIIIKKTEPAEPKKLVEFHNPEGEEIAHLEELDFIYLVPDTHMGSDQKNERDTWVMDLETFLPIETTITLPQVIERMFIEILSNAGDNCLETMNEKGDPGVITVTMDKQWVKVRNAGKPFKVKIHSVEKKWTPYVAFGMLHSGRNFDTNRKRKGCGRNGIGSKGTSIFSKRFIVDIGDPTSKQRYQQEWKNNMKEFSDPLITPYNGPAYVEVSYLADFDRFGYPASSGYPEEAFRLFCRYVYDYSKTIRVQTSFNGHVFEPSSDPKDHARFYFGDVSTIIHYEWDTGVEVIARKTGLQEAKDHTELPKALLIIADTPGTGKCVSFINGIMTNDGGVHVNEALKAVAKPILELVNSQRPSPTRKKGTEEEKKDDKKTKLTWKDVKNHLSILLVCHLDNPKFGGQTKERLTSPTPKFNIPDKVLAPITKWEIMIRLTATAEQKIDKLLASTNGKKTAHIDQGKGIDAASAGRKDSSKCRLFITEGDTALQYATIIQGMVKNGTEYLGCLPIRGKILNVLKAKKTDPLTIARNNEIISLKRFLGLEDYMDYSDPKNFARLRYGGLIILSDADDDGTHIRALVVLYFRVFYPSLLEMGYVEFLRTPIIRLLGTNHAFYTDAEYQLFRRNNPGIRSKPRYYKGLASSRKDDIVRDQQNPMYVTCISNTDPTRKPLIADTPFNAQEALDMAFSPTRADDRKKWMREWNYTLEDLNIGRIEQLPISELIDKELAIYAFRAVRRAIPSEMDGQKDGQRKIIWAAYCLWGKKQGKESMKVTSFGGNIIENYEYHHGNDPLEKAIIAMAQDFVGTNNLPLLFGDGLFGSRELGTKSIVKSRYVYTKISWAFKYIFKEEDVGLLKLRHEDGKDIEPMFMLPILPLHVINGAHGTGTGWSTHIPNHNPQDVSNWLKARLKGNKPSTFLPWYRGFVGEISVENKKIKPEKEIQEEGEEEKEEEEQPAGLTLVTKGKFHLTGNIVEITELPVGVWTNRYRSELDTWLKEGKISDYTWHGQDDKIHFKVHGFENPSIKNLKLKKSYGMTNMNLLNIDDKPIKYHSVDEMMEAFYVNRLPYFLDRKNLVIANLEAKILRLEAKMKYIIAVREKKINLLDKREDIINKLNQLNIPVDVREMKTASLDYENVDKLNEEIIQLTKEKEEYENKTPEDLWYQDLIEFDEAWDINKNGNIQRGKVIKRKS